MQKHGHFLMIWVFNGPLACEYTHLSVFKENFGEDFPRAVAAPSVSSNSHKGVCSQANGSQSLII